MPKGKINVEHIQSLWAEDTAGNKIALNQEVKDLAKVEAMKNCEAVAISNNYLTEPTLAADALNAGSYTGTYQKKVGAKDRTVGAAVAWQSPEGLTKTLIIDQVRDTQPVLVIPSDENASSKAEHAINTAIINTPITEIDENFFLKTVTEATNYTQITNFDTMTGDAFTKLMTDSIVALKSKVDDYQSGYVDSDIAIVMTFAGLAKYKNTLTDKGTGSETQAKTFLNSLEVKEHYAGIPILVSNRLPAGIELIVTTINEWGATAVKAQLKPFTNSNIPGEGDAIGIYSQFLYGIEVIFPGNIYVFGTVAQPTKSNKKKAK